MRLLGLKVQPFFWKRTRATIVETVCAEDGLLLNLQRYLMWYAIFMGVHVDINVIKNVVAMSGICLSRILDDIRHPV